MLALAVIALFFVQTNANASENSDEATASINWDATSQADSLLQADTSTARITMYRLYNSWTGEHFYTSNTTEKSGLVKAGWKDEGIGWYAPKKSNTPVYRLYNPYVSGGDHHYTTDVKEYNNLAKQGWKKENVGWYSVDATDTTDRAPLYRQYNPFAQTGTHNYTMDKKENDNLVKKGWKAEGIGWYGYSKATPSVQPLDFSKIKVTTTAKTYNTKAQTQTITSSAYKLNTDYTVTYSNNKNAGTAKITVKGTGKYTGSRTYNFKINKATLNVSWENVALTYNAKAQAPQAKVTGVLGTDKVTTSVSGAKTNAGENYTATATVNNSNYQLSGATTKFSIAKAPLTLTWGETAFTYNAKAQKPTATIASGLQGSDTVTVNVAGEQTAASDEAYTATATINNANYALTGETSKQFTIAKLDITNAEVTLGDALTYNAGDQTQSVSKVYVGDAVLTEGVDFDVTGNTGTAAGTYNTLTVTGKTNCTGAKANVEFKIAKAPITVTWTNISFTYDASSHKPDATFEGTQGEDTITLTVSGDQTNANAEGENYEATASLDATSEANYEITEATKTVKFTIAKADPTYTTLTDPLNGELNKELSTVTLPDPGATDTPGKATWDEGTTVMEKEADNQEFKATFTPTDTDNYNTLPLVVKVNVKGALTMTFKATAPGSESITMDGVAQTEVTKSLSYDDLSATTPTHTLVAADFPTIAITSTNSDGYQFAGWSTTQNDTVKYGIAQDQIVSNTTKVTTGTTYYAVWLKGSGYWMGTKGAGKEYTNEAYFATHDKNYVPASSIAADKTLLRGESGTARTEAVLRWQNYYNNDIRLYATYEGGENEGSYDATTEDHNRGLTSELNKYVEFRIIQVGSHDNDGSEVTFMATHLLPTAYSMNTDSTNVGGWNSSELMTKMNADGGAIYKKFATDLKLLAEFVTKTYGTGSGTTSTATGSYKFWLLSGSEFCGSSATLSEGSQYAWCKKNSITWNTSNNILANWKTRAGATPGSAYYTYASWWQCSPNTGNSTHFLIVDSDGNVDGSYSASDAWGVAPAFSM